MASAMGVFTCGAIFYSREKDLLDSVLPDGPFVQLCGKRYIDCVDEVTRATVCSNLPERSGMARLMRGSLAPDPGVL